jgi:hypothetical protein
MDLARRMLRMTRSPVRGIDASAVAKRRQARLRASSLPRHSPRRPEMVQPEQVALIRARQRDPVALQHGRTKSQNHSGGTKSQNYNMWAETP